jgi:hypothetical protein
MDLADGESLNVNEADPRVRVGKAPVRILTIENWVGKPLQEERLRQAIAVSSLPRTVTTLCIGPSSRLNSAAVVELLPKLDSVLLEGGELRTLDALAGLKKLTRLVVETYTAKRSLAVLKDLRLSFLSVSLRRPDDAGHVAACRALEGLQLWNWNEEDLTTLKGMTPRTLRMVRGRHTSLRGLNCKNLRSLWLQSCGQLRKPGKVRAPKVTIDGCNALDLDSLGEVEGLLALDLFGQKELNSLEFVRKCRSLRLLSLGARKMKLGDLRPVIESPTLELLYGAGLTAAQVEEISNGNPKLFVTSPKASMLGGKPAKVPHADRHEALEKKYKLTL